MIPMAMPSMRRGCGGGNTIAGDTTAGGAAVVTVALAGASAAVPGLGAWQRRHCSSSSSFFRPHWGHCHISRQTIQAGLAFAEARVPRCYYRPAEAAVTKIYTKG